MSKIIGRGGRPIASQRRSTPEWPCLGGACDERMRKRPLPRGSGLSRVSSVARPRGCGRLRTARPAPHAGSAKGLPFAEAIRRGHETGQFTRHWTTSFQLLTTSQNVERAGGRCKGWMRGSRFRNGKMQTKRRSPVCRTGLNLRASLSQSMRIPTKSWGHPIRSFRRKVACRADASWRRPRTAPPTEGEQRPRPSTEPRRLLPQPPFSTRNIQLAPCGPP